MLEKAGYILSYWVTTYVAILVISSVFLLLLWSLGIQSNLNAMKEILEVPNGTESPTLTFFLSSLVLAPILEEITFRHPLKDFQYNFLLSIAAILLLFVISLFTKKVVGFLLLLLGMLYTITWLLLQKGRIRTRTSSKAIYILSMIFFVLAHFGSLEAFKLMYWPIYTLYGAHMAVCAYFLAKIRLRKDTYYSIFLHFLYNLVPALFLIP